MKTLLSFLLLLAIACLGVCGSAPAASTPSAEEELPPLTFSKIDHHPSAADWSGMRGKMTSVPRYDPKGRGPWQMDLRCYDVSGLDLSKSLRDLLHASFDDKTVWPPDEKMPAGFDRQHIMELGKNPGLGVRKLHEQGITGRGIGIAIVDQTLLTKHQEYADRLRLYEEINIRAGSQAQMHGAAVASIALGTTVGVAPQADLYFIASTTVDWDVEDEDERWNFAYYAQAVRRIVEVNKQLPEGRKIRVISLSIGWNPRQRGYEEMAAAVEEAKAAGMLIICSSVDDVHGFGFHGLGREPLSDPDVPESYEPGSWWAEGFYSGRRFSDRLLVPMDSRTTAAPNGVEDYVFYRRGGWSWSIPYIAGVYALAAQVEPDITPDRFWSLAMKTGQTIELEHDGEKIPFGPIVDPVSLIGALQGKPGEAGGAAAGAEPEPAADEESEPITFPKIDRRPQPEGYSGRGKLDELPRHGGEYRGPWQVDLRAYDVSGLDLSKSLDDLLYASFDDDTAWPADDKMPAGFDRERIMELGKNPGLGVRKLHKQGITGRGIGIAIIDQVLLTEHQEYADRLRLYEEINVRPDTEPQMHGAAVASIALGKTVGVAPEADLYFIASWTVDWDVEDEDDRWNFAYYAQAVRRILEVNEQLPDDRKIRVISISVGWNPRQRGYEEMAAAVEKAKAAGMLVICSSVDDVHGFAFHALGRVPLSDPDESESYMPALWWAEGFYEGRRFSDRLLVPSDSRATASPNGVDEYAFYRQGGWSWSIPYIAGVYALAAQVEPEITPDRFWSLAMKTGETIKLEHDGEKIPFGPIVDPVALIETLRED